MKWPGRVELARTPTPLVRLEELSERFGKNILVWRDDLTGLVESGNKIRKLEFLLAEALEQGATEVITCGGPQSNHARATVVLARRLGLQVSVVLREGPDGRPASLGQGNHLIMRLAGARVQWVPMVDYKAAGSTYDPFLAEAAEDARERGERPYVVAEGGSSPLGALGYLWAVKELQTQWQGMSPPSLVCALGSGGTHAGLVMGAQAVGWDPERIFAVNVCDDRDYFLKRVGGLIDGAVERFGVERPHGSLQILDGYVGLGYAQTTPEELHFSINMLRSAGLWLDPVYTGKAFRAMVLELEKDPSRFGPDVIFLHSGGQMANFAFGAEYEQVLAEIGG